MNVLQGRGGSDVLDGGSRADILRGGLGNDVHVLDHAGDRVGELAGQGTDTAQSSVAHALATHVENLTLEGLATINGTGNALANRLAGNEGSNALLGLGGLDVLLAGGGADRLNGGAAQDSLSGGAGNPVFVLASRAEAGDCVVDFRNGTVEDDRFELTAAAFGTGLAARVALTVAQFQVFQAGTVTATTASTDKVRFICEAEDERLWSDSNGSSAGRLALLADLQDGATLGRSDLILV